MANGLSPKPHIDFFAPARRASGSPGRKTGHVRRSGLLRPLRARRRPIVRSLDAAAAARLYRAVEPLHPGGLRRARLSRGRFRRHARPGHGRDSSRRRSSTGQSGWSRRS
ncbi:MAG: hypothetical protein MZV70_29430 [Desulfobacterales bacterium]|nr:hypothetical protein [Desulfobacterales bacterium]